MPRLLDVDELTHSRDAVNKNVNDVRTSRRDAPVRRHGDGDGLCGGAGLEASVVEEQHAVTHVDRVGHETTVVEVDLDSLGVGRGVKLDGEGGAIGLEGLGGELDSGRTSGVALEVGRSVDLVAELSDVRILSGGLKNRLLDGVGTRD